MRTSSPAAPPRPGFRRRIAIRPGASVVTAAVEDDFHCMSVRLVHDGVTITAAEGEVHRAPWTTCPEAPAALAETFAGVALADASRRGAKTQNCTHLYDLAVFAAAHALELHSTDYEVQVTDPCQGEVIASLTRDGAPLLCWALRDDVLIAPEPLAGVALLDLRTALDRLPREHREPARILQWATFIAHGRRVFLEHHSDATLMGPRCYTFQPAVAALARRTGASVDFSRAPRAPLQDMADLAA